MEIFQFGAVDQLLSMLIGGGFLTLFWHWRNDQLAQYRYLDQIYTALLAEYRAYAKAGFGDPAKTREFASAFADDALGYHYFAMSVMNAMETIFDVLDRKPMHSREWKMIFSHHVRLHWPWLEANPGAFEPEFVAYVRALPAR